MTTNPTTEVRQLADDVWAYRLETQPVFQVRRGIPVTELRGFGLDVVEEDARRARGFLDRLDRVDTTALSHDDALTASFLRHMLELAIEAPAFHWLSITITPHVMGSWLAYLGQQVFGAFRFEDAADLDRYVHLVANLGALVRETSDKVTEQVARGILLPRPAVPSARATIQALGASTPVLLQPAAERLAAVGEGASQRIADALASEVTPAFDALVAQLGDDYERRAPEGVGVAQYDGGYDYYRHLNRMRNSVVDVRPEAIHGVGLSEVAALTEQMAAVRAELGFTGTEDEFHEQLRREPALYASTPEEVEARYLEYIGRLETQLPAFFSVLPKAPYGVERMQPELEASLTYGYYQPPTPDNPVGLYRYNASQLDQRSLLNAAAIVYHELAPGHHFHIARQSENESLPDIRREAIELGAFNEGWAEYAAGLAGEMGLYDDPLERYGRLSHERFIAQRLVTDTGMNVLGWTLEQGRAYMRETTFESDVQIESETLRYSTGLPAQALGYRLGHLSIRAARDRAEKALGPSFDVRAFHEAILGAGALPLPVLDEHIDWFIAEGAR